MRQRAIVATPFALMLVLLLLALSLAAAAQASAAEIEAPAAPSLELPIDPELDWSLGDEEELEEAGECEEAAEYEFEGEGEFQAEECEDGVEAAPAECVLRTAEAKAIAFANQDKVELVIRYASSAATDATVSYRFHGSKGSVTLKPKRQHLSMRGVFRDVEKPSEGRTAKAREAHDVTVRLSIPATPGYCQSFHTLKLTAKRSVHGQIVWTRAGSALHP